MTFVEGKTLDAVWKQLNNRSKGVICREIWSIIAAIRTIPRPPKCAGRTYQCLADGTPTYEPLLRADCYCPLRGSISDDESLRQRIYVRCLAQGGQKYVSTLQKMLPRSSEYVFTHSDIAPRNIIVGSDNRAETVIDWENASRYPHYWEYANIVGSTGCCDD